MAGSLRPLASTLLGSLCACVELPTVDPASFACVPEDVESCPSSHACVDESCFPRLGCFENDPTELGCDPSKNRCDLIVGETFARVACRSGTHLVDTSTAPIDREACSCLDGTVCATLATFSSDWPLYVLKPSAGPASEQLSSVGLTADLEETRWCVLPCGSERDCPGNHTCRAAAVVGTTADRGTVGVCYPDRLPTTSSIASAQLDPLFCASNTDCSEELGRPAGRCRVEVVDVHDHPARPAGQAWGVHRALTSRCDESSGGGLKPAGAGCLDSADCISGACVNGRCAVLCDPDEPRSCGAPACRAATVTRKTAAQPIEDEIFVCGR
ncbi:MAG: hypothetical protein HY791_06835 [Deltaproteobacteria bacterium]|nr:hypothetical protein [Deltaproteobacteria bacterium]